MAILICGLLIILAIIIGYALRAKKHQQAILEAKNAANKLIEEERQQTQQAVDDYKKRSSQATEQYAESINQELEDDIREHEKKSAWIDQRLTLLEQKKAALALKADNLTQKQVKLDEEKDNVQNTLHTANQLDTNRWETLQEVGNLPETTAEEMVLEDTKQDAQQSSDEYINNAKTEIESSKESEAEDLILLAMEHSSVPSSQYDNNRSLIADNQEYLGKIIGNSGQNVRAIEALTGVDIIIDDQEKEVIINGYDPVRRSIAMKVLEDIKSEKRVVPDVIEALVNKEVNHFDHHLRKLGEDAVKRLKVGRMAPDLMKFVGRMYYRTSYGQNILEHALETAQLAGIFAAELGENTTLARRAGLLHDIGKSIDRDVEGTHVEIGVELTTAFREKDVIINTIASHHGEVESKYVISDLVQAADAISGARQGARSESAADYLQRIKSLEGIANKHPEVEESYAIQAGRELRVIVQPKQTDDRSIHALATNVKDKIEEDVTYPGQVKVTVVRKLEIVEYAEKKQA